MGGAFIRNKGQKYKLNKYGFAVWPEAYNKISVPLVRQRVSRNMREKAFEKLKKEVQRSLENNIVPGEKLKSMNIPPPEFIVERLIPKYGLIVLAAKPSSFKSWLCMEIARSVSIGGDLFKQFKTDQGKVLYLDEESSLSEIKRRWLMMAKEETPTDFCVQNNFKIGEEGKEKELVKLCKKEKYNLVIIDAFRDIFSGDENDSQATQKVLDSLKKVIQAGTTILLIHHTRKEFFTNSKDPDQMLRGSSNLLAGLDSLLSIENTKTTEKSAEIKVVQSKLRQGKKAEPFKLNVIEREGIMNFEYEGVIETDENKVERAKNNIKDLLVKEGELFQTKIIEFLVPLGNSPRTIRRAVKDLRENNELSERYEGRKLCFSYYRRE